MEIKGSGNQRCRLHVVYTTNTEITQRVAGVVNVTTDTHSHTSYVSFLRMLQTNGQVDNMCMYICILISSRMLRLPANRGLGKLCRQIIINELSIY